LSGLDVNQTWMNVIGNNIANDNTTAFKASRTLFQSQFYVDEQSSTAPNGDSGGTNASQIGLGSSVASVQQNFTQGSIQSTGVDTDMAINGNGYFVTQSATNAQQFTRDGAFTLDSNNQLVSSSGAFVQGYTADSTGNIVPGKLSNLTIPLGAATNAKATSNVTLTGNLDAGGVTAAGGSTITSQDLTLSAGAGGGTPTDTNLMTDLVSSASGDPVFTVGQTLTLNVQRDASALPASTFTVSATSTLSDFENFVNGSLGIDTTQAGSGTQLVAGTAANSVDLQIVGNSGTANALTMQSTSLVDSTGNAPLTLTESATGPTGESVQTSMTVYDSLGDPVAMNITAVLQSSDNTGTSWKYYVTSPDNHDTADPTNTLVGTGTLNFNTAGGLVGETGNQITIDRDGTGAEPDMSIDLNFGSVSALSEDATHEGSQLEMTTQDGVQLGTLSSFSVGTDGIITGSFDNGQTRTLGQLAVATFDNQDGLQDDGDNMYSTGPNSGSAVITAADTLGAGQVQSESLEQSNVDISNEFINMINASTGFSAASRVITTSDQMITDLLNSAR
jgi:flagellar hook protein FlgE